MLSLLFAVPATAGDVRKTMASLGRFHIFDHTVVIAVPMPKSLSVLCKKLIGNDLMAYGMCVNHWVPQLPFPLVLLNAGWFGDAEKVKSQYDSDAQCGWHPKLSNAAAYVLSHEAGHFLYAKIGNKRQAEWYKAYIEIAAKRPLPSGYSTSAEECFCEVFSMYYEGAESVYVKSLVEITNGYL